MTKKQQLITTAISCYPLTLAQLELFYLTNPDNFFETIEKFLKIPRRDPKDTEITKEKTYKEKAKEAEGKGYMHPLECAIFARKSTATIRKWAKRYKFKSMKVGRSDYILKKDLAKFLN